MESHFLAGEHLLKSKKSFSQFLFMIFLAVFSWLFWNTLGIGVILSVVTLKLFTIEGLKVITIGILLLTAFILLIDGIQELGIAGKKLQGEEEKKNQTFNYKFKYKDSNA
tara:strand:- start:640 stop:969 length:330 start_codon:yes stop_codon:yes gene_type:complete